MRFQKLIRVRNERPLSTDKVILKLADEMTENLDLADPRVAFKLKSTALHLDDGATLLTGQGAFPHHKERTVFAHASRTGALVEGDSKGENYGVSYLLMFPLGMFTLINQLQSRGYSFCFRFSSSALNRATNS